MPAERAVEMPPADTLAVADVKELLQKIEAAKSQALAARVAPAREAAAKSLQQVGAIADAMDREKLKLEELEKRFGSTAENSKRTVVSTLRRESSADLPQVQTAADAKKFKERLESMMNRFGEVSGSHSKMLNYFMPKHAGRMKDEFASLSDLLKEVRSILAAYEQERAPVVKCNNTLNTISQKLASIRSSEQSARAVSERITLLEQEIAAGRAELVQIKGSEDFARAQEQAARIAALRRQEEQFHAQASELFSHVSRAFTKYSYGVSRETERRLRVMEEEPWKIFADDLDGYSMLLGEVHKAVESGKLQLKDADRILGHLAAIRAALPEMQKTAGALAAELAACSATGNGGQVPQLVQKTQEVEARIAQQEEELARERQALEQLKRQMDDKNAEVDALLREVSDGIAGLTGKRYEITR